VVQTCCQHCQNMGQVREGEQSSRQLAQQDPEQLARVDPVAPHLLLVLPLSARRMMKNSGVRGIHSASAVPITRSRAPVTVARMAPNSTPAASSTDTSPALSSPTVAQGDNNNNGIAAQPHDCCLAGC
jgi:hypothetical protein